MTVRRTAALLMASATVLAVGLVGLAPPASAHNEVASTTPAANSTVTTAPTEVVLHFEEAPLPGGTAIVVRDPKGTPVTSGKTVMTGADATIALAPLTLAGKYAVTYRSASDDGHTVTGAFTFTVPASAITPSETPTPTPTPTETPAPTSSETPSSSASSSASVDPAPASSSGGSAVPWLIAGLAVVAVVGVVVALLRRRSA